MTDQNDFNLESLSPEELQVLMADIAKTGKISQTDARKAFAKPKTSDLFHSFHLKAHRALKKIVNKEAKEAFKDSPETWRAIKLVCIVDNYGGTPMIGYFGIESSEAIASGITVGFMDKDGDIWTNRVQYLHEKNKERLLSNLPYDYTDSLKDGRKLWTIKPEGKGKGKDKVLLEDSATAIARVNVVRLKAIKASETDIAEAESAYQTALKAFQTLEAEKAEIETSEPESEPESETSEPETSEPESETA
jgi:hypothetical protein